MKKSSIAGWKDVFTFTLKQTLKSKAFIVSYVIMVALAVISMPIMNMLTSGATKTTNAVSPIKKIYINNETTLPDINITGIRKDKNFSNVAIAKMSETYDTVSNRIETQENESVILTISDQEGIYTLSFVKASKGSVGKGSLQRLGDAVAAEFKSFRINTLGITQDQLTMLNAPVSTVVSLADANGVPIVKVNTSITPTEYGFIYGILFVTLMVSMMASTQIATSIVTEKSTRVIEYLMISIKPLALIVGKVLAMLIAVLLQLGSMVVMIFASNIVITNFVSDNKTNMLAKYLPSNIFQNLNIMNILSCLVLMALGFVFYSILAGLAGATVSKLEEIQEGLMLFTLTSIVGAYMGLGAASALMASGENAYVHFTMIFPLSSPFILPGALLIGKASLGTVAIATVLQIVFIILLFLFVAKVFETLILHNGSKIKPNELIKIFKRA